MAACQIAADVVARHPHARVREELAGSYPKWSDVCRVPPREADAVMSRLRLEPGTRTVAHPNAVPQGLKPKPLR